MALKSDIECWLSRAIYWLLPLILHGQFGNCLIVALLSTPRVYQGCNCFLVFHSCHSNTTLHFEALRMRLLNQDAYSLIWIALDAPSQLHIQYFVLKSYHSLLSKCLEYSSCHAAHNCFHHSGLMWISLRNTPLLLSLSSDGTL